MADRVMSQSLPMRLQSVIYLLVNKRRFILRLPTNTTDETPLSQSFITFFLMPYVLGEVQCALLNRLTQSTDKGRQAALSRGVRFGAPKKLDTNQVEEMREKRKAGVLIKDLMREYGLSKASVYRLMAS